MQLLTAFLLYGRSDYMSFTATWTATTGFDTSGYTVKFGKQLNQCTVDEIVAHPMCGSNHPLANCAYMVKDSELAYSSVASHLANAQFKEPILNGQSNTWVCDPAPSGNDALVYRRSIFVGMPTNVTAPQYCLTDECDSRIFIIEDIKDPNKLVYNYGNITWAVGAAAPYRTLAVQIKHTCNKHQSEWSTAPQTITYTDNTDPDNPVTTIYKICIYHVYTIGTDCFIVGWDYIGNFGGRYQNANNQYNFLAGGSNYNSFVSANGYDLFIGLNINHFGAETNLQGILGNNIYADPVPNPAVFVDQYITYAPENIVLQNARLRFWMSNSTIGSGLRSCGLHFDLVDTEEIRKQQMARAGIYFVVNGDLFKPIITGGIVTGYGTPDAPSEIDDYTDLNHPVPSGGGTPPTPPGPSGDEWDNMPITGSTIGALAGVSAYVCSKTDIASLKSWMSKMQADGGPPDGYDVLHNIISIMAFPIDMMRASAGPARQITFTGLSTGLDNSLLNIMSALVSIANAVGVVPDAQVKTFTSPVSAYPCAGNPFDVSLGTITCPVFYPNTYPYADYDASVEVYIPFVGCLPLDTQSVSGRELKATLSIDPVTGAVYGQCECYKADDGAWVTVAAGSGAMGVTTPISANQVGLAMAQIKNTSAGTRDAAITSALTVGTSALIGSPAAAGAVPSAVGTALANNRSIKQISQSNHNAISGSSGGTTADWSCHFGAYLKITAPNIHDAGDNYERTYGVPTISSGTLSSFTGFTVCVNPDVSGISNATDSEKAQIYNYLTGGVYV